MVCLNLKTRNLEDPFPSWRVAGDHDYFRQRKRLGLRVSAGVAIMGPDARAPLSTKYTPRSDSHDNVQKPSGGPKRRLKFARSIREASWNLHGRKGHILASNYGSAWSILAAHSPCPRFCMGVSASPQFSLVFRKPDPLACDHRSCPVRSSP